MDTICIQYHNIQTKNCQGRSNSLDQEPFPSIKTPPSKGQTSTKLELNGDIIKQEYMQFVKISECSQLKGSHILRSLIFVHNCIYFYSTSYSTVYYKSIFNIPYT